MCLHNNFQEIGDIRWCIDCGALNHVLTVGDDGKKYWDVWKEPKNVVHFGLFHVGGKIENGKMCTYLTGDGYKVLICDYFREFNGKEIECRAISKREHTW